MNKKEIATVRKTMNVDKTTAETLCVCHVNIDREVTVFPSRYFGRIPEEEAEQYMDLFKKVFSGKMGTNLHTLHLPLVEAGQDETQDPSDGSGDDLRANSDSVFDKVYGATFRDGGVPLSQVAPAKVTVKSSDILITCPPELSGHITVGEVDGEQCIIVRPNGGVTLNGIPIRMGD